MKKILMLSTGIASPAITYSQSYNSSSDSSSLAAGIIVLGIGVLIFLVLRQVMIWYWKIDHIIKNQETTNTLLSQNNALLNEQILFLKEKRQA